MLCFNSRMCGTIHFPYFITWAGNSINPRTAKRIKYGKKNRLQTSGKSSDTRTYFFPSNV